MKVLAHKFNLFSEGRCGVFVFLNRVLHRPLEISPEEQAEECGAEVKIKISTF